MKPMLKFAVVCAATSLLAACASSPDQAYVPEREPAPGTIVTDSSYVAMVERIAQRRGIQVQWVHKPTRRASDQ
jgi:hypothetical protein